MTKQEKLFKKNQICASRQPRVGSGDWLGGWGAVARAGQKQQDQKNDRDRDLVKRDEEKGQPAHRAGVDKDEVATNEQRENGGRRGNEQSGDSSATTASGEKTCAA